MNLDWDATAPAPRPSSPTRRFSSVTRSALHADPRAGLPAKGREQLLSRLRSKGLPRIAGAFAAALPEAEALVDELEGAHRGLSR